MTLKRKIVYFHLKAKCNEVYPVIFMIWSISCLFAGVFIYPLICAAYPLALVFLPIVIAVTISGVVTIRDFDFETFLRAKYQIRNIDYWENYERAREKIYNMRKQIRILKNIKHIDIL